MRSAKQQQLSGDAIEGGVRPVPFLRWAGSKRRTVDRLVPLWSSRYSRYVEPFAGSASLFFALSPDKALLSDTNHHLIRTYRAIQSHAEKVYATYASFDRSAEYYYSIRREALSTEDDILLAARFLYLNRNCFNGLFRTNRSGNFNVPHSSKRVPGLLDEATFYASAQLIRRARFEASDFETILRRRAKSGDFVYLDPPFAVKNVRIFTQYGPDCFGLNDLDRLASLLHVLHKRGVHFVLSYADCPEARSLFCGWNMSSHEVLRHISGFAAHRKNSLELVVTNLDCA
jgi:DNA adenine methylase